MAQLFGGVSAFGASTSHVNAPEAWVPSRVGVQNRSEGADQFPVPHWLSRSCALFLDFDGTLVDLASEPEGIETPPHLPALLSYLSGQLGGALAVVSGRSIAAIDRQLHLAKLCVAGVHGAERRCADGQVRRIPVGCLDEAMAPVLDLCSRFPALRIEKKPGAVALHYRHAPELEDTCIGAIEESVTRTQGMALQRGKFVVELKPGRASKGAAVRAFMDTGPFRSRRPWFFGDDVTDESAFEFVQSIGGVAVKIGGGETLASRRLADPQAMRHWLIAAAERLSSESS